MGFYLGLVGAARISEAALAEEQGDVVAHILAPPLTLRVNAQIAVHLSQTLEQLATIAGMSFKTMVKELEGICVAMSGVYSERDRAMLRQVLQGIGLSGPSLVPCEDANAHLAANFLRCGGVVIASTGSNVFLHGHGKNSTIRIDGWGSVIGDEGGGYELGIRCLHRLLKGVDGRMDRPEALEKRLLRFIGLSSVEDLVPWYYSVRGTIRWRSDVSDLAIPLVQAAEIDGDLTARGLVTESAELLLDSLKTAIKTAVRHRTTFVPEPIPIILEGGLFRHSRIYQHTFAQWLDNMESHGPQWKAVPAKFSPVVGALALAFAGREFIEEEDNHAYEALSRAAQQRHLDVRNRGQTTLQQR